MSSRTTKSAKLVSMIANEPMSLAAAVALVGDAQARNLINRGVLRKYTDENPMYQAGLPGQKPVCYWVALGDTPLQQQKRIVDDARDQRVAEQDEVIASLTAHISLLTRRCDVLERRLRKIQQLAVGVV